MAKKPPLPVPESTSKYLDRISWEYARYTLDHRGIPTFTDGLKSAQRIALHLMRTLSGKMKTAAFAGSMIEANLYVHGDKNAADAISNMAAPYTNNRPLVGGEGAFGTRGSPAQKGAPRYTSIYRAKFAEQALYTDWEIVPEMENYDGSVTMPATFLPLLPLVLLNGIRGIATGWSTFILPRGFDDLKAATLEYLNTGKISGRLFPRYEKYDVRVNRGDGPGKFIVTGKFERLDKKRIRITEIPVESQSTTFKLADYRAELSVMEDRTIIADFTDRSKDTIDIEIELGVSGTEYTHLNKKGKEKRGVVPEWTDDNILDVFGLRHALTERFVVLGPPDDPGVRQMETAHDVVKQFVDWRMGWYRVRYERLERLERDKELFQRCYLAAFEPVVVGLKKIESKSELKEIIAKAIKQAKLEVREEIVERLAVLPVYRWTGEEKAEAARLAKEADQQAREYAGIAKSPARQKRIYVAEVEQIGV
jgi:DNA gyrase/topoisomerase IV subunit A